MDSLPKQLRPRTDGSYLVSTPIQGHVITAKPTSFDEHIVLPLTISQAYRQCCDDNERWPDSRSTAYIYWKVMNGDVMLTLSSAPITINTTTSSRQCLVCYIARRPSAQATTHIELPTYLNNGVPFMHARLMENGGQAASSTKFHRGCDTDEFFTLCLRIKYNTRRVTLWHVGSNGNLAEDRPRISHVFDESKLDLKTLEFIHISAGNHAVPVRNLIVTFRNSVNPLQQPSPHKVGATLLTAGVGAKRHSSVRSAQRTEQTRANGLVASNWFDWSSVRIRFIASLVALLTLFIIFRSSNISRALFGTPNPVQDVLCSTTKLIHSALSGLTALSSLLFRGISLIVQYFWLYLLIQSIEYLLKTCNVPEWKRKYDSFKRPLNPWHIGNRLSIDFNMVILSTPTMIKLIYYCSVSIVTLSVTSAWTLTVFVLRYQWMLLTNLVLKNLEKSRKPKWYKLQKRQVKTWCGKSLVRQALVVNSILIGPLILDKCICFALPAIKFIMSCLWTVLFYSVRYEWLIILLFVIDTLGNSNHWPTLSAMYKPLEKNLTYWFDYEKSHCAVALILLFSGSYLIERCSYYAVVGLIIVLKFLWRVLLIILRYEWLILLIFMSESLANNGNYPRFSSNYKALREDVARWYQVDRSRRTFVFASFVSAPFVFDQLLNAFLPVLKETRPVILALIPLALVLIGIGEHSTNTNHSNYHQLYRQVKSLFLHGLVKSYHVFGCILMACFIAMLPHLVEIVVLKTILMVKYIFYSIRLFTMLSIRCGLTFAVIMASAKLAASNVFPKYTEVYESTVGRLFADWKHKSNVQRSCIVICILSIPFLSGPIVLNIMWKFITIVKQTFLIIVSF